MSRRNLPRGKERPVHKAENLNALVSRLSRTSGNLYAPKTVKGVVLPNFQVLLRLP
jgi:hypothetical protein